MKKFNIIFVCLTFIMLMGFKLFESSYCKIPRNEEVVNKLLKQNADLFSKNYQLHPIGITVGMPSGVVKLLGLEFQIYGPVSKEQIRKTLINCSQELLSAINDNLEIRPYLESYPFTIDKIEIVLFVIDDNCRGVDFPHIRIADIGKSKLQYLKLITTDIPTIKDRCIETYEDALKAISE